MKLGRGENGGKDPFEYSEGGGIWFEVAEPFYKGNCLLVCVGKWDLDGKVGQGPRKTEDSLVIFLRLDMMLQLHRTVP